MVWSNSLTIGKSRLCKIITLAALVLIAANRVALAADYFTSDDLKNILLKSGSSTDIAMFRGYVAGVRDIFNGRLFCVGDNVQPLQAAATVRKYLGDHSRKSTEPAKLVVINALKSSYPCKK